ncbi:Endonuclease, Uma2 family (restriction endonuclease fold) [Jiangella alba]|uniref:Endonuclease, Uma2 family (Restriction endonuclease fold) n=2 Tax=Jiangella alba TaxID=561176 RepID=A0A1H5PR30_9ACTN|nr:Endonuclease, Uma2 family (restriction endonuclease fold) [Jiangella alba]
MVVVDMPAVELPTDLERWTFDDLLALPESIWRFEIVDGGLLMTPPPSIFHDAIWLRLRDQIRDAIPAGYVAHGPTAVDLDPSYLIPDLVVLRHEAVRPSRNLLVIPETLLVVEVVSPGSVSIDRILKPAKYAEAGIPHFWRVELQPELSLTAYALPDGARTYTEVGTWAAGQTAPIRAPFEVDIEIAELAPDR